MAELICDTSALIALHQIGLLHILPELAPTVVIPAVAPVLLELSRHGFHMSPRLRETILKAAGETP